MILTISFFFKSKGSTTLSFGLLAGMAFGKMASKGHPESGMYCYCRGALEFTYLATRAEC